MRSYRKILGFGLLLVFFMGLEVQASTKTISSVSIKVNHKLEAGQSFKEAGINIGSSSGGDINVYTGNTQRYSITDVTVNSPNAKLTIGSEPSIKVTLEAESEGDREYAFKGSYSSSNINISGGEFISASKKDGLLIIGIRLRPVKGTYDTPYDLKFSENGNNIGRGSWEAPNQSSGYYDIVLYKGMNQVHSVEEYHGESYNFYPYMTSKGVYKFKVRSVPHTEEAKEYGKKSEWEYSDEYYIGEDRVSDGRGQGRQTGSNPQNKQVGWIKEGENWYYSFPDGQLRKDGWEKIDQKWYLFDKEGKMLTGWQTIKGRTYYLKKSGDMQTGWLEDGGKWYYLNSEKNGDYEGMLIKDSWLQSSDKKYYYMGYDGTMSEGWTKIGESWYFFYPKSGYMAYNTMIDTFYLGPDGRWLR